MSFLDEPWKRALAVLGPLTLVALYTCWQCVVALGVIAVVLLVAATLVTLLVLWIAEGSIF